MTLPRQHRRVGQANDGTNFGGSLIYVLRRRMSGDASALRPTDLLSEAVLEA